MILYRFHLHIDIVFIGRARKEFKVGFDIDKLDFAFIERENGFTHISSKELKSALGLK